MFDKKLHGFKESCVFLILRFSVFPLTTSLPPLLSLDSGTGRERMRIVWGSWEDSCWEKLQDRSMGTQQRFSDSLQCLGWGHMSRVAHPILADCLSGLPELALHLWCCDLSQKPLGLFCRYASLLCSLWGYRREPTVSVLAGQGISGENWSLFSVPKFSCQCLYPPMNGRLLLWREAMFFSLKVSRLVDRAGGRVTAAEI